MHVCLQKKVWWKDFWWNKRTLMRDFAQLQPKLNCNCFHWQSSEKIASRQTMWSFPIINVSSSQSTWRIIMGVCEHQKTTAKKKRLKEDSRHKTESWASKHVITVRKKLTRFAISHVINALPASFTQQCALHRLHRRRHSRTLDLIQTVLRFYFLKFLLIWWWWNENFIY